MLRKVISGFQNGVDLAAIRIASAMGFETGGTMPKGFRTLDGPKPEYAQVYGAEENDSYDYPPRTKANVENSDATLRIAVDFSSRGELCTLKWLKRLEKPYLDIDLNVPCDIDLVVSWLEDQKVEVLNVAGNSLRSLQGNEGVLVELLATLFDEIERRRHATDRPHR